MKHESIVVVYDSGLAIAEEIADKLGAETISVQSVNNRQIENCQSLVLAVEFQSDGFLTPHWQYVYLLLSEADLSGKNIAVVVTQGAKRDCGTVTKELCERLRERGAHRINHSFSRPPLPTGLVEREAVDIHIRQEKPAVLDL